jgi:hypothetical protein
MSKASDFREQRAEAVEYLRDALTMTTMSTHGEPQPILYFVHRRTSSSGMSRTFHVFYVGRDTGSVVGISHLIARACGYPLTADGVRIGGCGMDMRFAMCDTIAHTVGLDRVLSGNDIDYRGV